MKASMPAGRSSRVRLVPAGASGRKTVNLSLHMGSGGFWRRFGVFGDNAMILGHVPWNSDLGRRYAKPESDFKGSPSERPLFYISSSDFFPSPRLCHEQGEKDTRSRNLATSEYLCSVE